MKKFDTKALTVSALLIALSFVLNNLMPKIKMPYGGSATLFSMFFIFLISYLFGAKIGVLGAAAYGLLDMLISPTILSPVQVLLDYPIGFGLLGVGGVLRNRKYGLYTGYALSAFLRFLASFVSGFVFFASYTPEGFNPVGYSFVYNLSYIGIEAAATLVVLAIPAVNKNIDKLRSL